MRCSAPTFDKDGYHPRWTSQVYPKDVLTCFLYLEAQDEGLGLQGRFVQHLL